jgi:natural product precursor
MKKKKLDLKQLKADVLSREELKSVLGGQMLSREEALLACDSRPCSVWVEGNTYSGTCGIYDVGGGYYICECVTSYGPYPPSGGTSHCYT